MVPLDKIFGTLALLSGCVAALAIMGGLVAIAAADLADDFKTIERMDGVVPRCFAVAAVAIAGVIVLMSGVALVQIWT